MAQMYLSDESINKMPYSLEAEQSVLGTIILDPDKIREAANEVRAEDFYLEQHQHIYEAMRDMFLANSTIDPVTLTDELVKNGVYDASGGKSYITALAQSVPSVANLHDYLRIIREKAMLRRLISVSEEIRGMAYAGEGNSADILDRAEQLIFDIAEKNETKGFSHIKDVIVANYKHLDDLIKNGTDALGTPTYFSALDKYLIGMGKSDLVLVGARPGMGKTSFVLNIASQVALKTKKTVAIFSLEMSCEQLVSRLLSSEAWIESSKMRKGTLDEKDWDKLARAAGVLAETDILIDDTAGITVTGMKAKLRRVKNLGLVIIDYLQLMQSDRRNDNRVQEVADISRALKLMAKDLQVPIVTCAQLSRGPESRTDKTPMLSDLRDSGAIEQDADSVMFLFREDYYEKDPEKKNIAKCIIAKNRHGETATVELGWFGEYTKFTTLDTNHA